MGSLTRPMLDIHPPQHAVVRTVRAARTAHVARAFSGRAHERPQCPPQPAPRCVHLDARTAMRSRRWCQEPLVSRTEHDLCITQTDTRTVGLNPDNEARNPHA